MRETLNTIYENVVKENKSRIKVNRRINKKINKPLKNKHILMLTISDDRRKTYVVRGEGRNLQRAIKSAIKSFFTYKAPKFTASSLKLDIINDISLYTEAYDGFSKGKDRINYDKGIDGLAFGKDLHTILLPGEVTGYHILNENKLNISNSFKALKNHLPSTFSNYTLPIDESNTTTLNKIRTKSYFINKDGFHELYRGHQIFKDLTKQDLWEAIELTKNNYFKNVVQKSGKFIYSYLPYRNKREHRYNILRHAGTAYSMFETYELMPDKELLDEAERALTYLQKSIKSFEINDKKVKVVVERDVQKIGGNALAIVAMAKHAQVTNSTENIKLMQDLALWIKETQDDDGEFTIHKQRYSTREHFDFSSRFYPGQAILALVRLYHLDKNNKWLDVAENAANYLINIRDKSATHNTISHDHWLLYALNELYRERPKKMYLNHSFLIAEAMMQTQYTEVDTTRDELIGGYLTEFGNKPRNSTPAACKDEGLSAVHNLAKDNGYIEMASRTKNAIKQGIKFQLQMQLRPESVLYYKRKKLCLGAFQEGLRGLSLRNDFTQHNISSFIAYYNIINESH